MPTEEQRAEATDLPVLRSGPATALEYLRQDKLTKWNFFEIAVTEGGLDLYNKILAQSRSDSMYVSTLRVMLKYISMLNIYELNSRSFKFIYGASVKPISEHFENFTFLYSVLKKTKFTPLLYSTLHCIMKSAEIPAVPIPAQRLDNQFSIKIPDIVPIVLKLSKCSGFKEIILQDFYSILTSHRENQQTILEQCPGWQGWLAVLNGFAPCSTAASASPPTSGELPPSGLISGGIAGVQRIVGPDPTTGDNCNNYVVLIFSLFVFTCLQLSKQGHAQINHMLAYIRALNPSDPSELVSVEEASWEVPPEAATDSPSELLVLMVLDNVMTSLKMEAEYLVQSPKSMAMESSMRDRKSVESSDSGLPFGVTSRTPARSLNPEADRPAQPSSDFLLLDIKKRSSPLLTNLLHLFKTVEEVIFYPQRLEVTPGIPVSEKHQNLLSATINVISLCGLLLPAGANTLRNASGLTFDALRTLYVRMCAAWFYHMSPEDENTLNQHVNRCNKILGLSAPSQQSQPLPQLDQEGCFYMLYHLIKVAVWYESRDKVSELYGSGSLVAFMRELLAYYAPISLSQIKQAKESNITPTDRLAVSQFYAHLTNSRRSAEEFFRTLCDKSILAIVMPLLKERVKAKLNAETSVAASVSVKWNKGISAAVREYQDLENKILETTQKKEVQLSGFDFRAAPVVSPNSSNKPEIVGIDRRITSRYHKELRAQQARLWRRVVRMHLLIYGYGIDDVKDVPDITNLKIPVFHYKLNPFENRSRMRLKVKRNRRFQDHKDALVYSRGGGAGATAKETLEEVEEEVHKVIKRLTELRAINTRNQEKDESLASVSLEDRNPLELEDGHASDDEGGKGKEDKEKREKEKENKGEQSLMKVACTLITPTKVTNGTLELTTTHLYFVEVREEDPEPESTNVTPKNPAHQRSGMPSTTKLMSAPFAEKKPLKTKTWSISIVREIHLRRYLLCPSAIEIFIKDETNYFMNFPDRVDRNRFYNKINSYHGSTITYLDKSAPTETLRFDQIFKILIINYFRKSGLTEAWQRGEISNFDYLMHLNTIAGRKSFFLLQKVFFLPREIPDFF
jgi:hypothetical protein